ncbi:MAG: HD domain-containing protein [Firmicutes bacterium]|nr:HD domain-containing protein [Bacillota bacterium]
MEDTKKRDIGSLQIGERINDYFVATDVTLNPFRPESGRQGSFLRLTLSDRSGVLPAIMWEGGEKIFSWLRTGGTVVKIRGNVGQYRGNLQVVVDEIKPADEKVIDPAWFLPSSPRPRAIMEKELAGAIDQIRSAPLRQLLATMFDDTGFYQAFTEAPAAKVIHHAYLGGLLEHTLETFEFASAIAARYPQHINRDLLLTGALVHDCGKVFEYSWQGLAFDLTNEGKLFGHIVLGARLVEQTIASNSKFPRPLKQELLHMILAHHGIEEWGSPQPPKTLNAFALHQADCLSCELNHFQGLLDRAATLDGEWTAMDRKLGRSVFRGFLTQSAATREGERADGKDSGIGEA